MGEYKYNYTNNYLIDITLLLDKILKSICENEDIVKSISCIKNYNNELYEHSIDVSLFSLLLGYKCYLNNFKIYELFTAALLHDFGKIFIPKHILEKPNNLDNEERKLIEQHAMLSYIHLKQYTKLPVGILFGILDHHEKIDGSGYMQCKKGNSISTYAKIISIADVYDAMISDRVYRKRMPDNVVKNYLISNKGKYFDDNLTDLFLKEISQISKKQFGK